MKLSIRFKFILYTFCTILFVAGSISVFLIFQERQRTLAMFNERDLQIAFFISNSIKNNLYFLKVSSLRNQLLNAREINPEIENILVMDADGIVLSDSTYENQLRDQKLKDPFSTEVLQSDHWISSREQNVLKIGGPVLLGGELIGYINVGFSLAQLSQDIRNSTMTSIWVSTLSLGVGWLFALLLASSFSRPILRIAKAAGKIGRGRLDAHLRMNRKDELGTLADAVDKMAVNLKQAREELEFSRHQAEEANRSKTFFLANMSHEIRTPLNSISGYSRLLNQRAPELKLPYKVKEWLEGIRHGSEHLSELVSNIIDLSKIEAGKVELSEDWVSPRLAIKGICRIHEDQASKKNISLLWHVDPRTHESFWGDRGKLQQMLMNLVGNAIRYTPEGGRVELSVYPEGEDLCFIVEDNGPGIPEDRQQHIFDAFEQAHLENNSRSGSAGLGLAIARQLAEIQGGTITLKSRPGEGSRFTVRLPCKKTSAEIIVDDQSGAALPRFSSPRGVLVVEDDPPSREVLSVFLGQLGLRVRTAESGEECLAQVEAQTPDLVLLDINLPGISGLEVAARLRENPLLRELPLVAVTADAFVMQKEPAMQAGFDDYVAKPVYFEKLVEVLARHLPEKSAGEDTAKSMYENLPELPREMRKQVELI